MGLKDKFKKCLDKLKKQQKEIQFQYISESPISGDENNPLSFGHNDIFIVI